jgi:5-methylcytosine-specific restriction endonuclease McrA
VETRICNTCGAAKPLEIGYHRNKNCRGGYSPRCKDCRRIADQPYVEAHRDQIRERAREWAKANPERAAERVRLWVQDNTDRSRAIKARYRRSEKGKAAAARPRDRLARKATATRYYLKNRDRYRGYMRNRRARIRGAAGKHTAADVAALKRLQKGKCAYCRHPLGDRFEVDHHHPLALGGENGRANLQLLCRQCNRSKGAKHPVDFVRSLGLLV